MPVGGVVKEIKVSEGDKVSEGTQDRLKQAVEKAKEALKGDDTGTINQARDELMQAFSATLEEVADADLLLHVIDIHHPQYQKQVRSVERILEELELSHIPTLRVLNNQDRLKPDDLAKRVNILKGVPIAAIDSQTLHPLIDAMDHYFTAGRLDPALTDTTPSPSPPAM